MTMLTPLIRQLEELGRVKIEIRAAGKYPGKRKTKVSHVAFYQNDGTETITPAKFVERTAKKKREWKTPLQRAIGKYLSGSESAIILLAKKIALDINRGVNRIDTGRLRTSFRGIFIK